MVEALRAERARFGTIAVVNIVLIAAIVAGHWALVAAAAVGVPALFVLAQRPQRGMLLLAALVPFNGLLLIVPHPSVVAGWKEALTLAILLATFVAPAAARAPAGRRLPRWFAAAAGLVALGSVSALLVAPRQGAEGMKVSFFYLLVAWAAWRCPLSSRERDQLVTVLIADGLVTAAYGLVQEILGPSRLNALGYQYNTTIRTAGGHLRAFSTFNQPFPFAFFLMMVIVVGLPICLRQRSRLRSRIFLASLPFLTLALATTIVRAAWLGLGVGVVFLALERHRRLLLLIPAALLVLLLLPRTFTASAVSSSSSKQRATGWRVNVVRLEHHPFGIGIGATGSAAEKLAAANAATTTYQPDDYYVKTALELGIPGLWLFIVLLLSAFQACASVGERADAPDGSFGIGVAALVVAVASASTGATYLEIFPADVLFWLFLAVATAPPSPERRTDERPRELARSVAV